MTKKETKDDIGTLDLKMMYPTLLDRDYSYTAAEGWIDVFEYIALVFPNTPWLAEFDDYDDK